MRERGRGTDRAGQRGSRERAAAAAALLMLLVFYRGPAAAAAAASADAADDGGCGLDHAETAYVIDHVLDIQRTLINLGIFLWSNSAREHGAFLWAKARANAASFS